MEQQQWDTLKQKYLKGKNIFGFRWNDSHYSQSSKLTAVSPDVFPNEKIIQVCVCVCGFTICSPTDMMA